MDRSEIFSPKLIDYCTRLTEQFDQIDEQRRAELNEVSNFIRGKRKDGLPVNINVICTHNSRRSQIGQIWLEISAIWYNISMLSSYSGGTEATAFNHRSVAALQRAGIPIVQITSGNNPRYKVELTKASNRLLFSKKYNDQSNPQENFIAIMVCDSASEACPVVLGAEKRFAILYKDPKSSDDTSEEKKAYDAAVELIGTEIFYMLSQI